MKKILLFVVLMLMANILGAAEAPVQDPKKWGIGYVDSGLDLVYWKNDNKGIQANAKLSFMRAVDAYNDSSVKYSWNYRIGVWLLKKLKEYEYMKVSLAYGISWSDMKDVQSVYSTYYTRTLSFQAGPMLELFMPYFKRLSLVSSIKLSLNGSWRKNDNDMYRTNTQIFGISGTGFTIDTLSLRYYF